MKYTPSELRLIKRFEKKFPIKHYYCDDSWYSCPLAEGGCCDGKAVNECNCRAIEKHNEQIAFLIKEVRRAEKRVVNRYIKMRTQESIMSDLLS